MDSTMIIIAAIVGLAIGFGIAKFMEKGKASKTIANAKKEASQLLKEAKVEVESIKKDKILQAKEKFLELKAEHEKVIISKDRKINEAEKRTRDKESQVSSELARGKKLNAQLDEKLKDIDHRKEFFEKKQSEVDKLHNSQITVEEAKLTAQQEARKIVINTIQRIGTEEAVENCVSVFNIESDDVKGRIIGREGRNIRALEAATGVEIIVDDTPEAIILSCFDSVRREVARLSLHKLVTDGRIHPARIEEIVKKTEKQIEQEIVEVGKRAVIDLGIHGLHPELVRAVGRMKYRSSYGQNLLQHSREVAKLCGVMAAELGLNPKLAKRAGLLHDIGKVPDDEPELPHAVLGLKLAEKYKEKPEVCNAIGSHHEEVEMSSLLAPVVQVCDAISGARPGARREAVESYIQRLRDLEDLALSFEGVTKTYAIQAGRELRVIVGSDQISDNQADKLSYDISKHIEDQMTYPGQVKVTVIREKRAVNYAK